MARRRGKWSRGIRIGTKGRFTYIEGELDAVRELRHAGERFRSATSGVV